LHTSGVRLFGAPCDGKAYVIQYANTPPITQTCKGETYHLYPSGTPDLHYVTEQWTRDNPVKSTIAGQRDVFQAFHRLMHTLGHRNVGERARVIRARQRIKRAVR
jgi:hypothetical protein